jgi:hypothetical protein
MVAAKRSVFSLGEQRRAEPSERNRSKSRTCRPKLPADDDSCHVRRWRWRPMVTNCVPRRHWQEPATRQGKCDDLGQTRACLATQNADIGVKRNETVQSARIEQNATFIQAAVTIGATQAARQVGSAWYPARRLITALNKNPFLPDERNTAPTNDRAGGSPRSGDDEGHQRGDSKAAAISQRENNRVVVHAPTLR